MKQLKMHGRFKLRISDDFLALLLVYYQLMLYYTIAILDRDSYATAKYRAFGHLLTVQVNLKKVFGFWLFTFKTK